MIQITATHINISTRETILNEFREFKTNGKAMKYLKSLDKSKMQSIADKYNLGTFKRGLIRANKSLDWNLIKTNIKIVTV
jgi:hypothetical protein